MDACLFLEMTILPSEELQKQILDLKCENTRLSALVETTVKDAEIEKYKSLAETLLKDAEIEKYKTLVETNKQTHQKIDFHQIKCPIAF